MIPVRTDYRMTRTPWVNYALILANILIFLLGYNGMRLPLENSLLLIPSEPQVHQFFTSLFLHAGWGHLLGNMVFLWTFGNALNDRLGNVAYLAFYLAGGVFACIGYLALGGSGPVLGASGAISAVAGAYLVLLPRVRVTVLNIIYVITYFEVSSLVFLMIQFVWNLMMTRIATGAVAYSAHSAGYVFGITSAGALLATGLLPRDAFDLPNLIRSARRRGKFRRMVAGGWDPFDRRSTMMNRPPKEVKDHGAETVRVEVVQTSTDREQRLRADIREACTSHNLVEAAEKYLQLVRIADQAVLPMQQQLDVANQLMAGRQYPAAADAYERFLKHYGNYEHLADIYLMLGLLYCRYLDQYDRAEQTLEKAVSLLKDPRKIELAKGDLQKLRGRKRT
ncbi:MAG: rhomboid family intramembrane serine protease [Planctomycetes bacterium]|nr:rhomboid family intramembrane serine protease [Planctomycetota bacterium]